LWQYDAFYQLPTNQGRSDLILCPSGSPLTRVMRTVCSPEKGIGRKQDSKQNHRWNGVSRTAVVNHVNHNHNYKGNPVKQYGQRQRENAEDQQKRKKGNETEYIRTSKHQALLFSLNDSSTGSFSFSTLNDSLVCSIHILCY
jgi:hypothetical protein